MEPKKTVKKSYDAIANLYLESRSGKTADLLVLDEFIRNLPGEARVLDAGCGAGIPVSKSLSDHFDVTGVDFSEVQIELAKRNVPGATFLRGYDETGFPRWFLRWDLFLLCYHSHPA
jgi:2-polyprenyl-3-methyl-5-hydroxy-6-metoxy-1,4-benzoquinol methylase